MKDENRLKNIFWTLSDFYDFDISKFSLNAEDPYEAAILGYSTKYFDFYILDDFFKKYVNTLNNKKDLWEISKLVLENIFSHEMIMERPGTLDFKKDHDEEILKNLRRRKIVMTTELKIGYIRNIFTLIKIFQRIQKNLMKNLKKKQNQIHLLERIFPTKEIIS